MVSYGIFGHSKHHFKKKGVELEPAFSIYFYVDDLLTGAQSMSELLWTKSEISHMAVLYENSLQIVHIFEEV